MTHLGISSGRAGSVGIIIAIKAIRHIWSATLTVSMECELCRPTIQAVAPVSSAQLQTFHNRLTPSRIHPDRFWTYHQLHPLCKHTLSCSSRCRKAMVSMASFPVDLSSAMKRMGHTCKYQAELYPQLRNSFWGSST